MQLNQLWISFSSILAELAVLITFLKLQSSTIRLSWPANKFSSQKINENSGLRRENKYFELHPQRYQSLHCELYILLQQLYSWENWTKRKRHEFTVETGFILYRSNFPFTVIQWRYERKDLNQVKEFFLTSCYSE